MPAKIRERIQNSHQEDMVDFFASKTPYIRLLPWRAGFEAKIAQLWSMQMEEAFA